jgi:hypothetical protein
MRKNPYGPKDSATSLGALFFFLLVISPIWLVILAGLFAPLIIAVILVAIPIGVIYNAVRK